MTSDAVPGCPRCKNPVALIKNDKKEDIAYCAKCDYSGTDFVMLPQIKNPFNRGDL